MEWYLIRYLYQMESKLFSYKVEGIVLEPLNEQIKISPVFDRKELVEKIKEIFIEDGFKPDEHSLELKIEGGQLFIQGIAVKRQENKSIGFMTST